MSELSKITDALRKFAADRDWDQFHTPKNLAMALTGEVGELVEHFQWVKDEQIPSLLKDTSKKEAISDEIADVFSYLVRLSDKLEIDIGEAFWKKIDKNNKKYPADLAKGSAKKYTEYD